MQSLLLLSFCLSSLYISLQSVNSQPSSPELQNLQKLHNDYRHKVMNCELENQPPAKYLPDLQWDNDLAHHAQLTANKCALQHSKITVPKYQYIGQNAAIYPTMEGAIEDWFNEYKDYDYNTQKCSFLCGHYTQMVWQNTTNVGCGVKDCTKKLGYKAISVVCNYGEA
ncbi:unnamed protein product [Trichobilharzia regenti]|nr:unnamed protein product [Trichobilharzia regenti]